MSQEIKIIDADEVMYESDLHKNSFNALSYRAAKDDGMQLVSRIIRVLTTIGYVLCDILRELATIRKVMEDKWKYD